MAAKSKFCVIFDMDGLIFDSEKIWKITAEELNEEYNINIDEKFRLFCCGRGEDETIQHIHQKFPHVDAALVRKKWGDKVHHIIQTKGVPLKKGFLPLLQYLQKNNVPLGLATGSKYEEVLQYFKSVGLDAKKIFKSIVPIEKVTRGKPNPQCYKIAIEELGFKPEDCIVVEDSPNGALAGIRAGCKVLLIPDVFMPTKKAIEKCVLLKDLIQAKEYLQKYQKK